VSENALVSLLLPGISLSSSSGGLKMVIFIVFSGTNQAATQ
jgi:hypothetical protein